jgi:hypothetical protein
VLGDSVSALGFQIAFYYGLTGLACVVYYRRALLRSASGFVFAGGVLMLWAWVRYRGFFRRRIEVAPPDALERPPATDAIAPELPTPTGVA